MNKNAEMLNYIYKNASMGVYTVKQTVCMAKNEDFRKNCLTNTVLPNKHLAFAKDCMRA